MLIHLVRDIDPAIAEADEGGEGWHSNDVIQGPGGVQQNDENAHHDSLLHRSSLEGQMYGTCKFL